MKNEPLDFVGVDYAVDNREVEKEIFPLAQEKGIGILNYVPSRVWRCRNGPPSSTPARGPSSS